MVAELLKEGGGILMSYNNAGIVGLAHKLKVLTTNSDEVVVRPEAARAKLATCAWMVRWCTVGARLR